MPRARHLATLLVPAVAAALHVGATAAAGPPAAVTYRPPVAAPVVDGFRPPTSPYGPGNLGLEYDTTAGDDVRAAAAGIVTFAGQVAGRWFVTVLHDDRIRTTYGRLRSIAVQRGDAVGAGQVVGDAGEGLIWTARLGGAHLDPMVLLAASGHAAVRLVPDLGSAGRGPAADGGRLVPQAAAEWALE